MTSQFEMVKLRCKNGLLFLTLFGWIFLLFIVYSQFDCSTVSLPSQQKRNIREDPYRQELKTILEHLDSSQGVDAAYDGEDKREIDVYRSSEEKTDFIFNYREKSLSDFVDEQIRYQVKEMERKKSKGSFGRGVVVHEVYLDQDEHQDLVQGWVDHGLNEYASDMISVNRSLPDPRATQCKYIKYPEKLPNVSVIITFYNEAWSVLLRTVYSVIQRSPPSLLTEVILVDDCSDQVSLGKPLKQYLSKFENIKILRTSERRGPIMARMLGYKESIGSVLVFLESHVECTEGWLEPLLDRIARNGSTVVSPVVDWIVDSTFEYKFQGVEGTNVGGFNWNLDLRWEYISRRKRAQRNFQDYLPVRTATTAGIYALSREFFDQIGTYEGQSNITAGVESLEFSFRVWMCGGSIEVIPCSHVGHVYRQLNTWKPDEDTVLVNKMKLAEIWMDDFKIYFYDRIRDDKKVNIGDITPYRETRQRLNCKSFRWYLQNVYPEVFIPGESMASGQIINKAANVCIEAESVTYKDSPVTINKCHPHKITQDWIYTDNEEIRRDDGCLDYFAFKNQFVTTNCHSMGGNQLWEYRQNNTIYHPSTNKCLTIGNNQKVVMDRCSNTQDQIWIWNRQPAKGPVRR